MLGLLDGIPPATFLALSSVVIIIIPPSFSATMIHPPLSLVFLLLP